MKRAIEDIEEPYPLRKRTPLSKSHPEVSLQWLYGKNCGWGPEDFSKGSNIRVWWHCPKGPDHIFQQEIHLRVRRFNSSDGSCPFCKGLIGSVTNSLEALYPEVAKELLVKKSGISASEISFGSRQMLWWRCAQGHDFEAVVANRTILKSGCSYCSNQMTAESNSLSFCYPEVAAQWHPTRNKGVSPDDVRYVSRINYWWRCSKRHVWQAMPYSRCVRGSGCRPCFYASQRGKPKLRRRHTN